MDLTVNGHLDQLVHRSREPLGIAVGAAVLLCLALGAMLASPDPTAAVVWVLAVVFAWAVFRRPLLLYAATLAQLSIIPAEGHMFGFFVPNMLQFFMPALMISIVCDRLRRRSWGLASLNPADLFVVAFLLLGYVGLLALPGGRQFKYYTNQVVFPAMLYFATRWLELDREKFLWVLRVLLTAAFVMLAIMALTPLTGRDPIYYWEAGYKGIGADARGPIGGLSDTAAYASLWVPLFLYAAAVPFRHDHTRRWLAFGGCALAALAALGTHERISVLAVAAGVLFCLVSRDMRRYAIGATIALSLLGMLWVSTRAGATLDQRFREEDPMVRRRLYVQKAVNYIRSSEWNPWLGTGFARLSEVSLATIPETLYVWDGNWKAWRQARPLAARPVHCAPLTLLGEYGFLGCACLIGVAGSLVLAGARVYLRAGGNGRQADTALVVAGTACALTVVANGLLHNTDTVHQVATMCWAYAGLLVGHPDVFALKVGRGAAQDEEVPNDRTGTQRRARAS